MKQPFSIRTAAAVFAIAGVVAYLAPMTTAQPPQSPDSVTASFERELNHEPGPSKRVRRESIEHDELYEALNQVHWTGDTVTGTEQLTQAIPTGRDDNEKTYD